MISKKSRVVEISLLFRSNIIRYEQQATFSFGCNCKISVNPSLDFILNLVAASFTIVMNFISSVYSVNIYVVIIIELFRYSLV